MFPRSWKAQESVKKRFSKQCKGSSGRLPSREGTGFY